jgi:macrodomain Ter protein organizer (MatP/YcbG family)
MEQKKITANYGVGIVISADTREVLDYVVLSNVCELCKAAKKLKNDPVKYEEWKNAHVASGLCQKSI